MKDIKIFPKKKKKKKQQYSRELFKDLSENEKQKLAEYRKKYYRMRKNALLQLYVTILIYKILLLYKGKYKKLFFCAYV